MAELFGNHTLITSFLGGLCSKFHMILKWTLNKLCQFFRFWKKINISPLKSSFFEPPFTGKYAGNHIRTVNLCRDRIQRKYIK